MIGATASGPASPAAQASRSLSLKAISMAAPHFQEGRGRHFVGPFFVVSW